VDQGHLDDFEVAGLQANERVELVVVHLVYGAVAGHAVCRVHQLGQGLSRVRLLDGGRPVNLALVLERRIDHRDLSAGEQCLSVLLCFVNEFRRYQEIEALSVDEETAAGLKGTTQAALLHGRRCHADLVDTLPANEGHKVFVVVTEGL